MSLRDTMKGDLRLYEKELATRCRHVARDLLFLADKAEGGDGVINDLGEIQARGPIIDTLCAKVGLLRRLLREEGE